MLVYVLLNRRLWVSVSFAALLLMIIGGGTLILNQASHGWYTYYTLRIPASHHIMMPWGSNLRYLINFFEPTWPMLLLSVIYAYLCWLQHRRETFWFYGLILGSFFSTASIGLLNQGGWNNALIPAHIIEAIMACVCLSELSKWSSKPVTAILALAACLLLSVEFVQLYYPYRKELPKSTDYQAGYSLLRTLAQVDGEVYDPSSSYLNIYVNKPTYAHIMSVWELEGLFGGDANRGLENNIDQALAGDRFQAIVVDHKMTLRHTIPACFGNETVLNRRDTFMPVTGWENRPDIILYRLEKGCVGSVR